MSPPRSLRRRERAPPRSGPRPWCASAAAKRPAPPSATSRCARSPAAPGGGRRVLRRRGRRSRRAGPRAADGGEGAARAARPQAGPPALAQGPGPRVGSGQGSRRAPSAPIAASPRWRETRPRPRKRTFISRGCARQTEDDIAGARLHCEAALRLSPDQPDALLLLGELCHRAGEHLRAIKALDRLREVALARHELDRVGQANLLAGQVWEEGLKQLENALLRYREAVSLLPGEPEPLFLAAPRGRGPGQACRRRSRVTSRRWSWPGPRPAGGRAQGRARQPPRHGAAVPHAAGRSGAGARAPGGRARAGADGTLVALEELIPYFRATGRAQELADALEKAAAVYEEPAQARRLWAEAGELYRGRLAAAREGRAAAQLCAIEADRDNRAALEALLALAEAGATARC